MQCVLNAGPCVMLAADPTSGIVGQFSLDQAPKVEEPWLGYAVLTLILLAAMAMMHRAESRSAELGSKRGVGKKTEMVEESLPLYAPNMFTQQQQQVQYAQPQYAQPMAQPMMQMGGMPMYR
jgi:hypothetical protein